MFAVEALMLPSGLRVMVPPDCAFARCTLKANIDKLKSNTATIMLEAILLTFSPS
jgi:hypothetical protein